MHKNEWFQNNKKQEGKPIMDDLNEDLKPKMAVKIQQNQKGKIQKQHRIILLDKIKEAPVKL